LEDLLDLLDALDPLHPLRKAIAASAWTVKAAHLLIPAEIFEESYWETGIWMV
jgi:hypothetical protein